MSFKIYITKDFDAMSQKAGEIMTEDIKKFQSSNQSKENYVLGLATGNTPVGAYKALAKAANAGEFDPTSIVSFNLDEYVGLPGNRIPERVTHPESYAYFMIQELFGLLEKKFKKTHVPNGTEIEQEKLIAELEKYKDQPDVYEVLGTDKGKQINIKPNGPSEYLNWIKAELIDGYIAEIKKYGGINLHIVGVGGRGHVAFHESGIPLDQEMLLVKLDENTIENAVTDGHFAKKEDSPNYATSMGAEGVYRADTVLLVANGPRKTGPVAESILGPVTADVPISYGQKYSDNGGNMIYVLDEPAAQGILDKIDDVKAKGYEVIDLR